MHRSVKARTRHAASAIVIISLLIISVGAWQSRTHAGASLPNDEGALKPAEINAIVDLIERFSEAPNVQFSIEVKLTESCARNDCTRERKVAVLQIQRELDAVGRKNSVIAGAIEEHRIFIEASVGLQGPRASRLYVKLSSEFVPATASCPLRVNVMDEATTSFFPTDGLPLTAGSKVTLKTGSRIEVRAIGSPNPVGLFIDADANAAFTGKRWIGVEGLRFEMPMSEVRLSIVRDESISNDVFAQPRGLGDVIIGMQAASPSVSACEWKFLPKQY